MQNRPPCTALSTEHHRPAVVHPNSHPRTAAVGAGLAVLLVTLLGLCLRTDVAHAAKSGEGSTGQAAGPTYVSQDWLVYVDAGGTLEVTARVPALSGTDGTSHPTVTEVPGELRMTATSTSGAQQVAAAPWDTVHGANVTGSFGPALEAGVWRLQLTATTASGEPWPHVWAPFMPVDDWSITPRDGSGVARSGRVWTEEYYQAESGMTARGVTRWDQTHWLLSDTGVIYRASQLGFNGFHSRMVVDNLGLTDEQCQPLYRSVSAGQAGFKLGFNCPDVTRYRIFFEAPDPTMPATARFPTGATSWVMPAYTSPSVPALTWTQLTAGERWGGDLNVTLAGQAGTVEVLVDVDADGRFDGERDVHLSQVVPLGTTAFAWDGTDATGEPVPLSQPVRMQAQLTRSGEIHFLQSDLEYREGGLEIEALTGPHTGSRAVWWDDSELAGCHRDSIAHGLATCDGAVPDPLRGIGVDSTGGVHAWGAGAGPRITYDLTTWGDGKHIDDWAYSVDHAASEVLHVRGDVEVTKTADTDTLQPGQTTTHTWTVENTGDVDLVQVEVVDDLSGVLVAGDIDPLSITATTGDVVLDLEAATLTWTGDLAVGASATVTYLATVHSDVEADVDELVDVVSVSGWPATARTEQTLTPRPAPTPASTPVPAAISAPVADVHADPADLAVTGVNPVAVVAFAAALLATGIAVMAARRTVPGHAANALRPRRSAAERTARGMEQRR